MKYKKYYPRIYLLLLVFIFLLTSCSREEQVSKETEKKIIGISIVNLNEDIYINMKEAMYDLKERDNVEIIFLDAENKLEKQEKDIEYLIDQKVDIIIINAVNSMQSKELVEKIEVANIPVIAVDSLVKDVKLDGYITADNFAAGMEQASYLSEQIDNEGKIIILKGDKEDNIAYEITEGNKEILNKSLRINIVSEEWHKDWSPELAEQTVREVLKKYPDIKGVLANSSKIAMAAVRVLKEKNLTEKVVTVGVNASKEACIAIAEGDHDAEIDRLPYIMGLTAFKAAIMVLDKQKWYYDQRMKNGEYSIPVNITPVMLIDKYTLIAIKNRWKGFDEYIKKIE